MLIRYIGYTVNHKLWGEGIVEGFEGHNMSVHFLNTDKGERSVNFQYPHATNGHDPKVQGDDIRQ